MQFIQPKELDGKLDYHDNDVFIEEGVTLTEHEMKIYRRFREHVKNAWSIQFEED